jgi:hypothetical protein
VEHDLDDYGEKCILLHENYGKLMSIRWAGLKYCSHWRYEHWWRWRRRTTIHHSPYCHWGATFDFPRRTTKAIPPQSFSICIPCWRPEHVTEHRLEWSIC